MQPLIMCRAPGRTTHSRMGYEMADLKLYYHPFASYCQKVLVALYENETPFDKIFIDLGNEADRAKLEAVWPVLRFPVLHDTARDVIVPESSVIIEYLARHYPGPLNLIPQDPEAALEVRLMDRIFDNYIQNPMAQVVFNRFRPEGGDPHSDARAHDLIRRGYTVLEERLKGREWAAGDFFSMADCAGSAELAYAAWIEPLDNYPVLSAYLERVKQRPAFARVIDEARPHRGFFPVRDTDRIPA